MINQLIDKALKLRNKQRQGDAVVLLLPYVNMIVDVPSATGLLATLYWDLGDYKNSAKWFARTIYLSPHSETASLGLFHSLCDLGKYKDAANEMIRFLTSKDSAEYTRLLCDLIKDSHCAGNSKKS